MNYIIFGLGVFTGSLFFLLPWLSSRLKAKTEYKRGYKDGINDLKDRLLS